MRKCGSMMLVGALVLATASVGAPRLAYSQQNVAVCQGYAQNYARQHSRGPVAGGAVIGAVGGAIIGGLVGGPIGVAAALGGAGGAIVGGGARATHYNALYDQAFTSCMGG